MASYQYVYVMKDLTKVYQGVGKSSRESPSPSSPG